MGQRIHSETARVFQAQKRIYSWKRLRSQAITIYAYLELHFVFSPEVRCLPGTRLREETKTIGLIRRTLSAR